MSLSSELLAKLRCPQCKGDLEYLDKTNFLNCHQCQLGYRIEDDIPIMLIEEAISLKEERPRE